MKTKILSVISFFALALSLVSCSEKWEPGQTDTDKEGQVSMMSMGVDVSTAETVISRASVDLSDFQVKITSAEGETVNSWKYKDMPEIVTLPVGHYTVDVVSHEVKKAAWEEPLYVGSKEFDIVENKITDIGIVNCVFSNIKVSIRFTENLVKNAGDDVKVTVVANDEGTLEYTLKETRAGYFEAVPGSTTLVATLTGTIKGSTYETRTVLDDVAAGQHRIITYDFKTPDIPNPGESGTINPGVGIDISFSTINLNNPIDHDETIIGGTRPGQEEPSKPVDPVDPVDPDKPFFEPIKYTSKTIDFDNPNPVVDGTDYAVHIHADNGIAHLVVTIDSPYLTEEFLGTVGLTSQFDLAYPGEYKAALDGFEFPTGEAVIGETDIDFILTPFIPLLNLGGTGLTHKFILQTTDQNGTAYTKTLTFTC